MTLALQRWTWLISSLALAGAQQTTTANSSGPAYDHNPILKFQPQFARSLPVQILLTGIIFTLVAVLLIHLVFTAQYHWPLAPVNYSLQLSGVLTLFVSLIATLHVILSTAMSDSQEWPYMLHYIAVDIPPADGSDSWSTAELAAWYAMDATTSALVQITHIQFLTMLYPSQLEARLIFLLLGPLAIVSAAMELLPIHQNLKVVDLAAVIRNTCNAALSLLFTTALFIWGFLVNRKHAWRTDGGTAAFGAGALTLALISATLNFLYIPTKDEYVWLPGLMWAVVLWQSFLGWWWWVGGGMGVGEVEELLRREEKRERKRRARLAKRAERREKAHSLWRNASESLRFTKSAPKPPKESPPESIEMTTRYLGTNSDPPEHEARRSPIGSATGSVNESSTSVPVNSSLQARVQNSRPIQYARRWCDTLRRAHLRAAREQAMERVERRQQAYGVGSAGVAGNGAVLGWGLGSFGIRERERREDMAEHDDEEELWSSGDGDQHSRRQRSAPAEPPEPERPSRPQSTGWSMWWWGPLRRWRLQDSTTY